MDIFEILKKDHDDVRELFRKLDANPGSVPFGTLRQALMTHMAAEEQYFYPAIENNDETRQKTAESYREHQRAKAILVQMESSSAPGAWQSRLQELRQTVEHHIDEEEKDVFEKARKVLSEEKAAHIAEMFYHKRQLLTQKPKAA